ncbi:DeoR/GlpR transcriptional regulator [Anaerosalibacter bizertensis]|uniref:DeoR/GlpR family DNA-binding transcription regulator n=1 Tax=Anaerosalibacter bizertensis TaxID=932217 RepID=A0A844FHE8_9FIRM|nr:DeoR/GlpR family DNA-binding transcription regulator [Anaerosalibacter bizertensis]MBV1817975.1 DeoR/GlpR family DNA-binding transcription regulator [Bacteroidales bacterium MSK.15.36]HHV25911.1 DeoR/GlpR transcriptional regulator [Tissierellia bacterium]MBU5294632.1 DeoR/GlpR family DNA-binding transcription regulator [Anaerosalibacter bizertensis]MCB5559331.1 DeoR/GlpR family DNA-binding transcription regulator [Anaerosalibacter bizertensis]MCG4565222.1 DeoR/GlpR family DNA-binding transc
MFAEERRMKIIEMIKKGESVKVSELTKRFNVSESTIRRDLVELERSGKILRTHGGAVSKSINKLEATFLEKQDKYAEEKDRIGRIAASQIEDGDTIIIDSGTTTYYISKYLKAKDITIITNSIVLTYELANREDIEVINTGGTIRINTKAQVGPITERTIKQFRVNKTFLGANGLSIKYGVTTPTLDEAVIKQAMIDATSQVYLLVDESKFSQVYSSVICSLDELDYIITNNERPEEEVEYYEKCGIKVLT